jgi:hypothetical protein
VSTSPTTTAEPTDDGPGLDPATVELLTGSLRELFAESTDASAVSAALAELGWTEVVAADPALATTILFTEQGRGLADPRILDDVLLDLLEPVLPATRSPRAVLYPHPVPAEDAGTVRGVLLGAVGEDTELVAPRFGADGAGELLVLPAAAGSSTDLTGFDPGAALRLVEIPAAAATARRTGPAAAQAWTRAEAAGRRALASAIAGVCEAALAQANAHVTARVQYGKPIGAFQAVRHRMSESHVAVTATRRTVAAAWAAGTDATGGAWEARIAKYRAGRAQAEVLRHTVQVLGAMGLTLESDMHRFVTRGALLDLLLGDHRSLGQEIGADLLTGSDARPVVEI